ncbi:MAG: prepilin-type N-terminal cleavage/methylation domain-containing protein [Desulfuromonadales bacterium]|nr:prepilin-type N-terminal cleavage/methylation domain-containing protein [Desulfuromonadales bacterium]
MGESKNRSQGFTLVELMVALAIAGIALALVSGFFISQSKIFTTQHQIVELQQSLRVRMFLMEREIRQAGYNPGGLTEATADSDGIDNNCDGTTDEIDDTATLFVDESESIGFQVALASTVTFSLDKDGDGTACGEKERITYALNGTTLERNGRPLIANIEVLNFVYLDKNSAVATSIGDILSVQIAIIGRTKKEDPSYNNTKSYANLQGAEILAAQNDGFRRRLLTSQVYCRNISD